MPNRPTRPADFVKAKPGTVAATIEKGIVAQWTTEKILKEVGRKHPASKSGAKDVSFYRWKLKKDGFNAWLMRRGRSRA